MPHCEKLIVNERIFEGIYTTGTMDVDRIPEQSLVVHADGGIVIVTGCAHPGVDSIVEKIVERHGEPVRLLVGGFHLKSESPERIGEVIDRLDRIEIRFIAPSHCTGEDAISEMQRAFGERVVHSGVGYSWSTGG